MEKVLFATVFICVFGASVFAQRNPNIPYISREQIVNIGGTVNLECSVQYAQDYPVLWVKLDPLGQGSSLPISTGSTVIIRDNRFSLRYDMASSTYTLQVKDIQESDVGWYQCQVVISISNKITADVSVLVRIPPVIADNSTRSQVASEGQSVKLECYASGYPMPVIYWRRENNAILPTGGSVYEGNVLNVPNVKKEDRGTYYCVADNSVAKGARRNINLEVEFAPVVRIPRPRVGQALNYDSDLECHVEAYPPPSIYWIKDSAQISNNQHYLISNFATADEYTDSTLRIITVEKRQYGKYICQARNKFGSHEASAELYETVVPVCPPACVEYYNTVPRLSVDKFLYFVSFVVGLPILL
jgi:neuronal growth regulator 1